MTLFVVAFVVVAALVLVSWLMVRPLPGDPPVTERKWRSPSSVRTQRDRQVLLGRYGHVRARSHATGA
jgi:hypothetical protein